MCFCLLYILQMVEIGKKGVGVNGFLECKKISKQDRFCYGMCIKLRFG